MDREEGPRANRAAAGLEVGGARNEEADKAGFRLVNVEKSVHQWMGIKGFSTEEDKEKINFSYITKRMR